MKRGRIFIYLALIVIIAVAAGGAYLWMNRPTTGTQTPPEQTTPQVNYVEIVIAGQNIASGTQITEAMLSSFQIPDTALVQGFFTSKADVSGQFAKIAISQGTPITTSLVSEVQGINMPGSIWAPFIPQGLTAVAIPINRLSSVAYGIRDGDHVDIIVTMLLVDVDPNTQSILPNFTSEVLAGNDQQLTAVITSGEESSRVGTTVLDEILNQPIYLVPSESQRPRLVTQMILQNIQVLHVGTFPSDKEEEELVVTDTGVVATATPEPANQQTAVVEKGPDLVTLMVNPNDANTLVFLMYSGAKITLTLRNPNNNEPAVQTDAAMLEYLLTQYNIPVPAKLPYAVQPRIDAIFETPLPNDPVYTP
jgi:pilus assembly protein CpaB